MSYSLVRPTKPLSKSSYQQKWMPLRHPWRNVTNTRLDIVRDPFSQTLLVTLEARHCVSNTTTIQPQQQTQPTKEKGGI
ncbi:hypothetical protein YC2023_036082 [Brassica napus]